MDSEVFYSKYIEKDFENLLSELKKSFSSTFQEKIATEYLNCGIYDKIFINRCDVFSDDFYLFIYQTKLRINLPLSKKDKTAYTKRCSLMDCTFFINTF